MGFVVVLQGWGGFGVLVCGLWVFGLGLGLSGLCELVLVVGWVVVVIVCMVVNDAVTFGFVMFITRRWFGVCLVGFGLGFVWWVWLGLVLDWLWFVFCWLLV